MVGQAKAIILVSEGQLIYRLTNLHFWRNGFAPGASSGL